MAVLKLGVPVLEVNVLALQSLFLALQFVQFPIPPSMLWTRPRYILICTNVNIDPSCPVICSQKVSKIPRVLVRHSSICDKWQHVRNFLQCFFSGSVLVTTYKAETTWFSVFSLHIVACQRGGVSTKLLGQQQDTGPGSFGPSTGGSNLQTNRILDLPFLLRQGEPGTSQ